MMKRFTLVIVTMLVWSSPLHACSVCFVSKEGSLFAFYLTTAILTFIPLAMFGGIVYFIKTKTKAIENAES